MIEQCARTRVFSYDVRPTARGTVARDVGHHNVVFRDSNDLRSRQILIWKAIGRSGEALHRCGGDLAKLIVELNYVESKCCASVRPGREQVLSIRSDR